MTGRVRICQLVYIYIHLNPGIVCLAIHSYAKALVSVFIYMCMDKLIPPSAGIFARYLYFAPFTCFCLFKTSNDMSHHEPLISFEFYITLTVTHFHSKI